MDDKKNEKIEQEKIEEQRDEQLDLDIKRVKSLKTNVKGGTSDAWGGRSNAIELSSIPPLAVRSALVNHERPGRPGG